VEDIASGDGDFDVEKVFVCGGGSCKDTHTLKKIGEIVGEKVETGTSVEIGYFCGH